MFLFYFDTIFLYLPIHAKGCQACDYPCVLSPPPVLQLGWLSVYWNARSTSCSWSHTRLPRSAPFSQSCCDVRPSHPIRSFLSQAGSFFPVFYKYKILLPPKIRARTFLLRTAISWGGKAFLHGLAFFLSTNLAIFLKDRHSAWLSTACFVI